VREAEERTTVDVIGQVPAPRVKLLTVNEGDEAETKLLSSLPEGTVIV